MNRIELSQGMGGSWTVTARTNQGDLVDLVGTTLSARCWSGDDMETLFEPSIDFLDAPVGTMTLGIEGADTAEMAIGRYQIQVLVERDGLVREAARISLKINHSPGEAEAPSVYCSFQDLLNYAPFLDGMADDDEDAAGFVKARSRARSWLDDVIIKSNPRANPYALGASDWAGVSFGAGASAPSAWLRDALDGDQLVLTAEIREIVARKAISIICQSQVGPGTDNPYWAMATRFEHEADNLAKNCTVQLDTNEDGQADYFITLGGYTLK